MLPDAREVLRVERLITEFAAKVLELRSIILDERYFPLQLTASDGVNYSPRPESENKLPMLSLTYLVSFTGLKSTPGCEEPQSVSKSDAVLPTPSTIEENRIEINSCYSTITLTAVFSIGFFDSFHMSEKHDFYLSQK